MLLSTYFASGLILLNLTNPGSRYWYLRKWKPLCQVIASKWAEIRTQVCLLPKPACFFTTLPHIPPNEINIHVQTSKISTLRASFFFFKHPGGEMRHIRKWMPWVLWEWGNKPLPVKLGSMVRSWLGWGQRHRCYELAGKTAGSTKKIVCWLPDSKADFFLNFRTNLIFWCHQQLPK